MPSIDNAVKKGTDFEPEAGRYVLYAAWFCRASPSPLPSGP